MLKRTGQRAAILLDTKGPEIGTIKLENGANIWPRDAQTCTFTTDRSEYYRKQRMRCSYLSGVHPGSGVGNTVLVDDGQLGMTVTNVTQGQVVSKVLNNGEWGENKRVHLAGVSITQPSLAEKINAT